MATALVNLSLCFQRPSAQLNSRDKAVIATSSIPAHLPPNSILIKVDRFGFSANNITYQALGEQPHFRFDCPSDLVYLPDHISVIMTFILHHTRQLRKFPPKPTALFLCGDLVQL
jgi:hypothetical protein